MAGYVPNGAVTAGLTWVPLDAADWASATIDDINNISTVDWAFSGNTVTAQVDQSSARDGLRECYIARIPADALLQTMGSSEARFLAGRDRFHVLLRPNASTNKRTPCGVGLTTNEAQASLDGIACCHEESNTVNSMGPTLMDRTADFTSGDTHPFADSIYWGQITKTSEFQGQGVVYQIDTSGAEDRIEGSSCERLTLASGDGLNIVVAIGVDVSTALGTGVFDIDIWFAMELDITQGTNALPT